MVHEYEMIDEMTKAAWKSAVDSYLNTLPKVRLEQVADGLDATARYLQAHGWTQGAYLKEDGSACAVGAIYKTLNTFYLVPYQCQSIVSLMTFDMDRLPIIGWNDRPGRTKEEVISLFHQAATKVREVLKERYSQE